MKKINYSLLLIAVSVCLFSCGKDPEPPVVEDHGTISLSDESISLKFREKREIIPTIVGNANSKDYTWTSDNPVVATVKAVAGGFGEVEAKQVGRTNVTFKSTDGILSASCIVDVNPRQSFLNTVYFVKGVTGPEVRQGNPAGTIDESTTGTDQWVANVSTGGDILRYIYHFDSNQKLSHTIVVLSPDAQNKATEFLEERFPEISPLAGGVLYYDISGSKYTNAKAGVLVSTSSLAQTYGIQSGVMFTSK